jgi:uncharacterized hydantoinase/oxoprolinase family protein
MPTELTKSKKWKRKDQKKGTIKKYKQKNSRERVGRNMWGVLVAGQRRIQKGLSYDLH